MTLMLRSKILEQVTNENDIRSQLEKIAPIAQIRLVRRESMMRDFCFVDCFCEEDAQKIVEVARKIGVFIKG